MVEHHVANVRVVSSSLITRYYQTLEFLSLYFCGCSSVVEHHVANVRVVSSSLITRYLTIKL